MRFGKKAFAILLIIIALAAVGVVAFLQLTAKPLSDRSLSVPSVEPPPPTYIANSSIYLLSVNPSYGTYDGSSCFIINVTVRNDYTPEHPVPDNAYSNNPGLAWICLTAQLYAPNGNKIEAKDISGPNLLPFNLPQYSLDSDQTFSIIIYMNPASHDIDHYTLDLVYLGALAAP